MIKRVVLSQGRAVLSAIGSYQKELCVNYDFKTNNNNNDNNIFLEEKNVIDNNANYQNPIYNSFAWKKKKLFIQNTIYNSCRFKKHLI